ncbi:Serine/threonine-protein kinase CTR1 [Acorus calamus]|uniref:Serine/threonine-protein kinase CTR1 n=1 Tax=Acorus calamus TaxID=4465 RepID=A0AAV9C7Y2_ACOCL|nr:Serine/threonine-protein kinase CTR1 [Acorus calamus]
MRRSSGTRSCFFRAGVSSFCVTAAEAGVWGGRAYLVPKKEKADSISKAQGMEKLMNTFMKEFELWQRLRHPNIVQFLGVLKRSDRVIFLTEYLRNKCLAR